MTELIAAGIIGFLIYKYWSRSKQLGEKVKELEKKLEEMNEKGEK